jgi:hypothetical protein
MKKMEFTSTAAHITPCKIRFKNTYYSMFWMTRLQVTGTKSATLYINMHTLELRHQLIASTTARRGNLLRNKIGNKSNSI